MGKYPKNLPLLKRTATGYPVILYKFPVIHWIHENWKHEFIFCPEYSRHLGVYNIIKMFPSIIFFSFLSSNHQWSSDSALKTGRRKQPGSIPGHACRPSCLEFSMVFTETRINTGWNPLEKPPTESILPTSQAPRVVNWIHTQTTIFLSSFIIH